MRSDTPVLKEIRPQLKDPKKGKVILRDGKAWCYTVSKAKERGSPNMASQVQQWAPLHSASESVHLPSCTLRMRAANCAQNWGELGGLH